MIAMRLSEASRMLGAPLDGGDAMFTGCSTDSRTLAGGDLFFALRGEHFDGHRFLAAAAARGAAGAVVEQADRTAGLAQLQVPSTRDALGRLGAGWRARFDIPFVAVTGSNGKTTVKEMVASILARLGPTLVTTGNLNNDIGVPLTLFRLDAGHRHAVVELGANHAGEIAALVALVRPQVALVTQCAPAHLEGFGSIEGVARAKGEIFTGLGPEGTAVINADDRFAGYWHGIAGDRKRLTFGFSAGADVTATAILAGNGGMEFTLVHGGERTRVTLPLLGRHNVANALAATACVRALGVSLQDAAAGLATMHAVKGRLQIKQATRGARLIDDTYNANPTSLAAALAVLAEFPGRRWLVLGDMGELGPSGTELHQQAGVAARTAGVERLFAVGDLSAAAVRAFGDGGGHFTCHEDLVAGLCAAGLAPDLTVLVKGSRAMAMERVVEGLVAGD